MCGRRSKKKKTWNTQSTIKLGVILLNWSPAGRGVWGTISREKWIGWGTDETIPLSIKMILKKKNPPQVVLSHPILKWGVSHLACGDLLSEGPFVTLDFTAHLVNLIECKWVDSESCPRPHSYLLLLWLCSVFSFLILIRHQREE